MTTRPPLPPFDAETAARKARMAEDAWNTRDPARVALAYTEDSRWRNRSEFFQGGAAIEAFLTRKWQQELDYRLIKEVWAFTGNRIAVPLLFTVLFLMSVLMTSGYLMQGTAVEKENKVVEVLLASANPDEILTGKLLGLGGAGLLQITVWLLILLVGGLGIVPLLMSSNIEMPWIALALAIPLFLVAFLFFGSTRVERGRHQKQREVNAQIHARTAEIASLTESTPRHSEPPGEGRHEKPAEPEWKPRKGVPPAEQTWFMPPEDRPPN